MGKWIKCGKSVPEIDKSVIAAIRYNGKLIVAPARRASTKIWVVNSWMIDDEKVVAWIPLPDPPSDEELLR